LTKPNIFARLIDGTVGAISPGAALRRKYYRELLLKNKRSAQYAAAKTSRLTGPWSPADASVNDIVRASSPAVRARVRQLVRDFPIFARAVQVLIDEEIGDGLIFQSRVTTPDGKSIDEGVSNKIESAFNFWADQCDIAGHLHLNDFQRLAKRQELETGEYLVIKRRSRSTRRYLPFALQIVEADWLTGNPTDKITSGHAVDQGVEYRVTTGERVAYHFTDPDSWGKSKRVKADDVIHGFHTLRPGQLRGISGFASGVLLAHDLSEYLDAEIDTAKMAAKYLAFVKRDPATRNSTLTDGTGDDEGKKIDEIDNAIIEYLSAGEDITIATNPKPGSNFPPTVKLLLRLFAATTNVPYELLSFDYEGLTYSSSRISRNDFTRFLRPEIARHTRQFCNPVFYSFMESAVVSQKLVLPGFYANPARYLAAEWQPPGHEHVDPLRESKALISEVDALLRSPQEIAAARGRDYATILKEIEQAKKLIKAAGLEPIIDSTSTANNPAAVQGQKAATIKLAVRSAGLGADIEDMLFEILDKVEQTSTLQ
jgi:lambda family phage portal protein